MLGMSARPVTLRTTAVRALGLQQRVWRNGDRWYADYRGHDLRRERLGRDWM
jgi:hypothetical protein